MSAAHSSPLPAESDYDPAFQNNIEFARFKLALASDPLLASHTSAHQPAVAEAVSPPESPAIVWSSSVPWSAKTSAPEMSSQLVRHDEPGICRPCAVAAAAAAATINNAGANINAYVLEAAACDGIHPICTPCSKFGRVCIYPTSQLQQPILHPSAYAAAVGSSNQFNPTIPIGSQYMTNANDVVNNDFLQKMVLALYMQQASPNPSIHQHPATNSTIHNPALMQTTASEGSVSANTSSSNKRRFVEDRDAANIPSAMISGNTTSGSSGVGSVISQDLPKRIARREKKATRSSELSVPKSAGRKSTAQNRNSPSSHPHSNTNPLFQQSGQSIPFVESGASSILPGGIIPSIYNQHQPIATVPSTLPFVWAPATHSDAPHASWIYPENALGPSLSSTWPISSPINPFIHSPPAVMPTQTAPPQPPTKPPSSPPNKSKRLRKPTHPLLYQQQDIRMSSNITPVATAMTPQPMAQPTEQHSQSFENQQAKQNEPNKAPSLVFSFNPSHWAPSDTLDFAESPPPTTLGMQPSFNESTHFKHEEPGMVLMEPPSLTTAITGPQLLQFDPTQNTPTHQPAPPRGLGDPQIIQLHLLRRFFRYCHPKLPMIDEVSFMRTLDRQPAFLLNTMYAIGSTLPVGIDQITFNDGRPFFDLAKTMLSAVTAVPDTSTVVGLVILSFYAAGCGNRESDMFLKIAHDLSVRLGMSREPAHLVPARPVSLGHEIRRRVWWNMVEVDRLTAFAFGRSFMIPSGEANVGFPLYELFSFVATRSSSYGTATGPNSANALNTDPKATLSGNLPSSTAAGSGALSTQAAAASTGHDEKGQHSSASTVKPSPRLSSDLNASKPPLNRRSSNPQVPTMPEPPLTQIEFGKQHQTHSHTLTSDSPNQFKAADDISAYFKTDASPVSQSARSSAYVDPTRSNTGGFGLSSAADFGAETATMDVGVPTTSGGPSSSEASRQMELSYKTETLTDLLNAPLKDFLHGFEMGSNAKLTGSDVCSVTTPSCSASMPGLTASTSVADSATSQHHQLYHQMSANLQQPAYARRDASGMQQRGSAGPTSMAQENSGESAQQATKKRTGTTCSSGTTVTGSSGSYTKKTPISVAQALSIQTTGSNSSRPIWGTASDADDVEQQQRILRRSTIRLWSIFERVVYYMRQAKDSAISNHELDVIFEGLDDELTSWFETSPPWIQNLSNVYGMDPCCFVPPPWRVAYVQAKYYFVRTLLHLPRMEVALSRSLADATNDLSFLVAMHSAKMISEIIRRFLHQNPTFNYVKPTFSHYAFQAFSVLLHGLRAPDVDHKSIKGIIAVLHRAMENLAQFWMPAQVYLKKMNRTVVLESQLVAQQLQSLQISTSDSPF